jgi:hypothetical protein
VCDEVTEALEGATGKLSTIVAKRHPNVRCTTFDLPVVEPIAKRTIEAAGLSDRIATIGGDFFTDPLPKADVITMGLILHDWNLENKKHPGQGRIRRAARRRGLHRHRESDR